MEDNFNSHLEGEVEEALEDKKAALMQMGFDPAAVAAEQRLSMARW